VVKLPKSANVFKLFGRKVAPKIAEEAAVKTGARAGLHAIPIVGQILAITEVAAGGATELARLGGWQPRSYEELVAMGIPSPIARFEKAIEWFSIPEFARSWFTPSKVGAVTTPRVTPLGYVPIRERIGQEIELIGDRPTPIKEPKAKKKYPITGTEPSFQSPYSMV